MSPYWLPTKDPVPPPHMCCYPPRGKEGEYWTCPKDCGAQWVYRRAMSWEYPKWERVVTGAGRL